MDSRTQRLAQYWKSQVTNYLERYGIEVNMDSMQQGGSQMLDCDQQMFKQIRFWDSSGERETHSLRRSGS